MSNVIKFPGKNLVFVTPNKKHRVAIKYDISEDELETLIHLLDSIPRVVQLHIMMEGLDEYIEIEELDAPASQIQDHQYLT